MKSHYANSIQVSLSAVTYAQIMRIVWILGLVALAGCNHAVYTRDGVTDGDTFYLAPHAWADDDPVLQSWVSYSLMRSACQLELGGDNPARNSDYGCEYTARLHLLETWDAQRAEHPDAQDPYLDTLLRVRAAGYLDEYTVRYFGRQDWQVPVEVRVDEFRGWQKQHLRRHRPQTRIVGSWNYPPP
jgi:hypothetical protein